MLSSALCTQHLQACESTSLHYRHDEGSCDLEGATCTEASEAATAAAAALHTEQYMIGCLLKYGHAMTCKQLHLPP